MAERKQRTINGVPIPDDVVGIAPPEVAAVADVCRRMGAQFLYVGGIAGFVQTDQEKEEEHKAIEEYVSTHSTPLTPADREKIVRMEQEGYDELFIELFSEANAQNWSHVREMFQSGRAKAHRITSGWDPFHVVARYARDKPGPDLLRDLLTKHSFGYVIVNINERSTTGKTALHYAAAGMNAETVQILLDFKADATIRDNAGMLAVSCMFPGTVDINEYLPHIPINEMVHFQKTIDVFHQAKLLQHASPATKEFVSALFKLRRVYVDLLLDTCALSTRDVAFEIVSFFFVKTPFFSFSNAI